MAKMSQIQATLNLLKEGDNNIKLREEYKDMILLLGNTGAGKSTLTQWLAQDNNKLVAVEVVEGEYIINDTLRKIGLSTINSKTTFPDLVIDEDTNTVYYDFPGFSDTRNSSFDIATSYFIKKTIDHAETVKLVFVIGHPSVRTGVDRQDFLKLLRHATELIKEIDKYENSIAIIVTKVDNRYKVVHGTHVLIGDKKMIEGIAQFLQDAKTDLLQRLEATNIQSKELLFYENAVKLIDVLLIRDGDNFKRICIFRRPLDAGPLDEIIELQEEKVYIKNMLYKFINYTHRGSDDFGRTVSDQSKNDINDLMQEIDKNVFLTTCAVAENVHNYYDTLVNKIHENIKLVNINNIIAADSKLSTIVDLHTTLKSGCNEMQVLTQNIINVENIGNVSNLIYTSLISLNVSISNKLLRDLMIQGRYLEFLQDVSEKETNIRISPMAWASSFQGTIAELMISINNFQIKINNLQNALEMKIKFQIEFIGQELIKYYTQKEENVHDLIQIYEDFKFEWYKFTNITHYDGINNTLYTYEIMNITADAHLNVDKDLQQYILEHDGYFESLKSMVGNVIKYLQDLMLWYKFLIRFNDDISSYEMQKDTKQVNMLFGETIKMEDNNTLMETSLQTVLKQYCQDANHSEYDAVKTMTLDNFKLKDMKEILRLALKKPEVRCESNGKLLVKGFNVILSDFALASCSKPPTVIEIFALNKVFIDKTLTKKGQLAQMTIIAPTWEIRGKQSIRLDGLNGKPHDHRKAHDGTYFGDEGQDGAPGESGGSAGNFFGVGKLFINSLDLTISANGGDGAAGQDGGNGQKGIDGSEIKLNDPKKYLEERNIYDDRSKYSCYLFVYCEYNSVKGDQCNNGGNAGRGGAGGRRGNPGTINIVSVDNSTIKATTNNQFGLNGLNGNPGTAGQGGESGREAKFNWSFFRFWQQVQYSTKKTYDNCLDGDSSTELNVDMKNLNNVMDNDISLSYYHTSINEYLVYLKANLHDSLRLSSLTDFSLKLKNITMNSLRTVTLKNKIMPSPKDDEEKGTTELSLTQRFKNIFNIQ